MTDKEKTIWKYQRYMQDYLATISSVDDNVGRVLDYLKENDLEDNTIVVYTSDQGIWVNMVGLIKGLYMTNPLKPHCLFVGPIK